MRGWVWPIKETSATFRPGIDGGLMVFLAAAIKRKLWRNEANPAKPVSCSNRSELGENELVLQKL